MKEIYETNRVSLSRLSVMIFPVEIQLKVFHPAIIYGPKLCKRDGNHENEVTKWCWWLTFEVAILSRISLLWQYWLDSKLKWQWRVWHRCRYFPFSDKDVMRAKIEEIVAYKTRLNRHMTAIMGSFKIRSDLRSMPGVNQNFTVKSCQKWSLNFKNLLKKSENLTVFKSLSQQLGKIYVNGAWHICLVIQSCYWPARIHLNFYVAPGNYRNLRSRDLDTTGKLII